MAKKLSLNSYSRKTFILLTVLLGLIAALVWFLMLKNDHKKDIEERKLAYDNKIKEYNEELEKFKIE